MSLLALAIRLRRRVWHPAAAATRQFLDWWGGELLGLVPRRLQNLLGAAPARLALQRAGQRIAVMRLDRDGLNSLAVSDSDLCDLPTVVRRAAHLTGLTESVAVLLAPHEVLVRTLLLPELAPVPLARLLVHEIERRTSLLPEEVLVGVRVLERIPERRQARVAMVVSERATAEFWRELAREHGLRIGTLLAPVAAGWTPLAEPGLTARDRTRAWGWRAWTTISLAAISILLGGMAFAVDGLRMSAHLASVELQLRQNNPAIKEASALRAHLDAADRQAHFLAARRGSPYLIRLLDELARILPDDAWLTSMEVKGNQITIAGASNDAAQLVGLIEASPMFANARFRGSVIAQGEGKGEHFELSFELRAPAS